MELTSHDDLASGLTTSSRKPLSKSQCVKEYLGILSNADNPLTGRSASFVSFDSQKVFVEFEIICKRMRRNVLEAVTRERHGNEGVRIVRLLLETGKMDEKQVRRVFILILDRVLTSRHTDIQSCHDVRKRNTAQTIRVSVRLDHQHI